MNVKELRVRGWQLAVQSCEAQPQQGQPSSPEFATADSKIEKHKNPTYKKYAKLQDDKKIGKKNSKGNYRLKNIKIQQRKNAKTKNQTK